jgi:putative restriction endonuclease
MKERFIIANISWNPTRWRDTYVNPKAGHEYARKFPGHESLNFKFDKKGIDTKKNIFGFVQWKYKPTNFENGGIIVFYTQNTDERKGQIVGIYCNVDILNKRLKHTWTGFENNTIELNIKADKNLSILFPISLDANNYKTESKKRLTGQIGFSYHDISLAEQIVKDELIELQKSGIQEFEFKKLKNIYSYITGKESNFDFLDLDEIEQQELVEVFTKENDKKKLIKDLSTVVASETEMVIVQQKTYKRDNKTIAQLKLYRDFKCQICYTQIKKKNGGFYIEAAHIKPKHMEGSEIPENILILCPNHHKEFDYGKLEIINHTKEKIKFVLNDKIYDIDLKIK